MSTVPEPSQPERGDSPPRYDMALARSLLNRAEQMGKDHQDILRVRDRLNAYIAEFPILADKVGYIVGGLECAAVALGTEAAELAQESLRKIRYLNQQLET